jgi:membrane protein YdbS with pleckstrin-like domain
MYSIIIAIIFYVIGFWLMSNEAKKEPRMRNVWSYLSAILSLIMAVAITLMWLMIIF